jgi:hypothetical protein
MLENVQRLNPFYIRNRNIFALPLGEHNEFCQFFYMYRETEKLAVPKKKLAPKNVLFRYIFQNTMLPWGKRNQPSHAPLCKVHALWYLRVSSVPTVPIRTWVSSYTIVNSLASVGPASGLVVLKCK